MDALHYTALHCTAANPTQADLTCANPVLLITHQAKFGDLLVVWSPKRDDQDVTLSDRTLVRMNVV